MIAAEGKRVGIMQPYLFPYLGYFQLIAEVDELWLFDDVQFIRRGWMNRNRLMVNAEPHLFTIPVEAGERSTLILHKRYTSEATKALSQLIRTIDHAYASARGRHQVLRLLEDTRDQFAAAGPSPDFTACTADALARVLPLLGLDVPLRRTSVLEIDPDLRAAVRILAICRAVGARVYVNMAGGRALYDPAEFAADGISFGFLEPSFPPYDQGPSPFVPGLSILDLLARLDGVALENQLRAGQIEWPQPTLKDHNV